MCLQGGGLCTLIQLRGSAATCMLRLYKCKAVRHRDLGGCVLPAHEATGQDCVVVHGLPGRTHPSAVPPVPHALPPSDTVHMTQLRQFEVCKRGMDLRIPGGPACCSPFWTVVGSAITTCGYNLWRCTTSDCNSSEERCTAVAPEWTLQPDPRFGRASAGNGSGSGDGSCGVVLVRRV